MSEYQLEIKQLVDYPRCRIYRSFIQSLMKDRTIRVGNRAGLFHYTVLCSYANFRSSYKRIERINYILHPGEWICKVSEIMGWFRLRLKHQLIAVLDTLQEMHLIVYNLVGRGSLIKFSIVGWHSFNRILEYNAPCQKETGFFFLPIATATEIVSFDKCSEMDALLDMWINTVYNDPRVQGSSTGPVVYFRNFTGDPLLSYADLSARWGISKSTVGRYLQKLQKLEVIDLVTFSGTLGTAIYLKNYLSTMFEISDVMVDKAEVALALNIKLKLEDDVLGGPAIPAEVTVSNQTPSVSNSAIIAIVEKVIKVLAVQGFSCAACPKLQYKLLPLFECREVYFPGALPSPEPQFQCLLEVSCGGALTLFQFEVRLRGVRP